MPTPGTRDATLRLAPELSAISKEGASPASGTTLAPASFSPVRLVCSPALASSSSPWNGARLFAHRSSFHSIPTTKPRTRA